MTLSQQLAFVSARQSLLNKLQSIRQQREKVIFALGLAMLQTAPVSSSTSGREERLAEQHVTIFVHEQKPNSHGYKWRCKSNIHSLAILAMTGSRCLECSVEALVVQMQSALTEYRMPDESLIADRVY